MAGILAGVILFAAIFTTGFGFLLFINSSNQSANQANLQRAGEELQSGSEKLLVSANLTSPTSSTSPLWVKAINTGGVPSTIADVYVTCQANCAPLQSGQLISNSVASPPSHFLRESPLDLNVSLPYTLSVGASTKVQISPAAFNYTKGEAVVVSLLTSAGNIFSAQYPPPPLTNTTHFAVTTTTTTTLLTIVAGGPELSVSLSATTLCPDGTGGCTQTFSCSNCVTVAATVYNLANATATGVSVTLDPPIVGGTARVTPNSTQTCTFPGGLPSVDIPADSQATADCQYSANTGSTGGLASFSGSASGTIGAPVTSAEALSNSIEIGGLASVTTQGAFVSNFFFLKYSSCYQNTGGDFNTTKGCTPNVSPVTLSNLPSAGSLAAGSNFFVAFYVQVTNLINTPLPILQYSYTYGDSSISGETFFFLAGSNSSLVNGVYYPRYSGTPPPLTPYPSNCDTSPTPSNCIVAQPGQTVTLTFAACGYGAQNWAWGSRQDARSFDINSGCTGNPPDLLAPEAMNLGIVLSYLYNGVVYSQLMPFQGQQYLRSSSTSVSCTPSSFAAGTPTTCTATVRDTDGFPRATPAAGTVTFSGQAGAGTFNSTSCTISFGTCSVTYTPNLVTQGAVSITATYRGDSGHEASSNNTSIIVLDPTTTTVAGPCKGANVPVNTQTTCTVTVTDNTAGTVSTPTGTVTMSDVPSGSGSFGVCTLSQVVLGTASCTVSYQPSPGKENPITITATYNGDTNHAGSPGSTGLTATKRTSSVSVTCLPNPDGVSSATVCTATVSDTTGGTPVTPTGGTVSFSQNPNRGTFSPFTCSASGGTCQVNFTPNSGTAGTSVAITATYGGDTDHSPSPTSLNFVLNIIKASPTLTVGCSGPTCTATLTGFGGTVTGETITFSKTSGTGTISFPSGSTCTLSAGGTCSVLVRGTAVGSVTLTAAYGGDYRNLASSGTRSLTVSHFVSVVQSQTLCQGTGVSQPCRVTLTNPVTAGNVLVVVVTTERTGGTSCRTATVTDSQTGTLTAGTTAQASSSSGSGDCVYVRVFYVTIGNSGSDQVTVTLSSRSGLSSEIVQAYELSGASTSPTGPAGASCNSGCTATLSTSSFSYSASSFLVAAGSLYGNHITTGPAGFTGDQVGGATGNGDYVGHLLPGSGGTSTFSMGANSAPATWAEVVVQFAAA